jgi:hypothetical protein
MEWTKGLELAKVARAEGKHFDCATWLHKAKEMPQRGVQAGGREELTVRGDGTVEDYLLGNLGSVRNRTWCGDIIRYRLPLHFGGL